MNNWFSHRGISTDPGLFQGLITYRICIGGLSIPIMIVGYNRKLAKELHEYITTLREEDDY